MMKPKIPLYIKLPEPIYQQLKESSHKQNLPMTQIVQKAIATHLSPENPIASTNQRVFFENKPFSRFIKDWRGKTFQYALSKLGINNPALQNFHAAAAGIELGEKATQSNAYFYLIQRAEERGL